MKRIYFKTLCIAVSLLLTSYSQAADWFVKANLTSTVGDGHTWDGALCPSDFQMLLANGLAEKGDVFHIAGGTYTPASNSTNFQVRQGVTFIGGYATNLIGTDTTEPMYPSATPTIFSGDKNANDMPDAGDIQNILVVSSTDTVCVRGIEFRCAYFQGTEYGAGAVLADVANLKMEHCIVRDNASNYHGAAGLTIIGSFAHLTDCIFTGNKALSRGGAIRLANTTVETAGVSTDYKTVCVAERCQITDNSLAYDNTDGKYGAGIQITHGTLWLINSTVANNKAYCNGAGLSISDGDAAYILSSTLANNECTRIGIDMDKSYSYGSSIRMVNEAKLYYANSIMVEGNEDTGNKRNPACYTENYTQGIENYFISGGYNFCGTFYDMSKKYQDAVWNTIWKTTDQPTTPVAVNHYADIFGSNVPADNGGNTLTIMPIANTDGAPIADLQQLLTTWSCPANINVALDQRGSKRPTTTCRGAFDINAATGISHTTTDATLLCNLGNGLYRIADAKQIRIFSATGAWLGNTTGDTADLSALAGGLYLLQTEKGIYKIVK